MLPCEKAIFAPSQMAEGAFSYWEMLAFFCLAYGAHDLTLRSASWYHIIVQKERSTTLELHTMVWILSNTRHAMKKLCQLAISHQTTNIPTLLMLKIRHNNVQHFTAAKVKGQERCQSQLVMGCQRQMSKGAAKANIGCVAKIKWPKVCQSQTFKGQPLPKAELLCQSQMVEDVFNNI